MGATEWQKSTKAINCLEAPCVELVMQHFGSKRWTYLDAREAIIAKFCSEAFVASR